MLITCLVKQHVPTDVSGQARGADKIALAIDLSFPAATVRPVGVHLGYPKSQIQGIPRDLENKWWMCVWRCLKSHNSAWLIWRMSPSFGHSHNESRNGSWKLMNPIWSDFFVLMILMNLVACQLTFPWSGQVGTPAFLPGFGSPELMGGFSLPTTGFIGSQKDQVESSWSWHKFSTQNSLPADATYRTI